MIQFTTANRVVPKELVEKTISKLKEIADDNKVHMQDYLSQADDYKLPYCVKFNIIIDEVEYLSWGNGRTRDEATLKSFAELIERLFYSLSTSSTYKQFKLFGKNNLKENELKDIYPEAKNWLGVTTSGLAIHSSLKNARTAAINELIERHIILKAQALKISPYKVVNPTFLSDFKLPTGVNLNFYLWKGPLNTYVSVCHIQDSYNQTMYSFGASQTEYQACEKAFYESSGMIVSSVQNKGKLKSSEEKSTDMDTVRNYHLTNIDTDFLNLLKNPSSSIPSVDNSIKKGDFYYAELPCPNILGDITPLIAIQAVCPFLQPLFYGPWTSDIINPLAISISEHEYPKDYHVVV